MSALADDIDACCGSPRIMALDIGGGLSVNYNSDAVSPSFEEYKNTILKIVPNFFKQNSSRTIVTEFGKSLVAKAGVVVALVQDVLDLTCAGEGETRDETHQIAITHAGADLFLRTAYCPESFSHRIEHLDGKGQRPGCNRSRATLTIAGPLCFSGDILARDMQGCEARSGDRMVVLDAGANTLSLFSRHCSRRSPRVIGCRRLRAAEAVGAAEDSSAPTATSTGYGTELRVSILRDEETFGSVMSFWD